MPESLALLGHAADLQESNDELLQNIERLKLSKLELETQLMELEEERDQAILDAAEADEFAKDAKAALKKYQQEFERKVAEGNKILSDRAIALTDIFLRVEGMIKRDSLMWTYWQENPELKRLRKEGGME